MLDDRIGFPWLLPGGPAIDPCSRAWQRSGRSAHRRRERAHGAASRAARDRDQRSLHWQLDRHAACRGARRHNAERRRALLAARAPWNSAERRGDSFGKTFLPIAHRRCRGACRGSRFSGKAWVRRFCWILRQASGSAIRSIVAARSTRRRDSTSSNRSRASSRSSFPDERRSFRS